MVEQGGGGGGGQSLNRWLDGKRFIVLSKNHTIFARFTPVLSIVTPDLTADFSPFSSSHYYVSHSDH